MHHAADLILQDRLAGVYLGHMSFSDENGAMVSCGRLFFYYQFQNVGDVAVPGSVTFKETMNEEADHTM